MTMDIAPPSSAQLIELPELPTADLPGAEFLFNGNLNVIQNVKIKLTVRVGETVTRVGDLLRMKEDHVLKLDTPVDTPVEVLLDGHVVARGHLVAVDDNFGVRISELPKADA